MTEKTDKKDHILDIAENLFSELGFDGASTRKIAAEAGVNMAMLNYYFGSKDGLYKAVIERRVAGFKQTLVDLNEENISSWDKLDKCMELYADRMMSNNCFQRIIQREISLQQRSDITDFITDMLYANAAEVKRIITDGINNGSFRKVDVEFTIASIFGAKNYVINSTYIASRLFGKDLKNQEVVHQEIKPRLKEYLKDFLKAHLTKHDTQA